MNDVSTVIRERRSIRKYQKGKEIPQNDIDMMLEAAMMAPSANNQRPWEFIVIKSEELRKEIMKVHPYAGFLADASLAIIVCGRNHRIESDTPQGYWVQDCSAATENILLQAAGLGYGTVWCGVYPSMDRVEAIMKLLNLSNIPLNVIAVGVPDESPAARGFYDKERVTYL
ncbi:MAG: nitroreductase family protein [Lachnospiraceae bacterium]|jgi:nitroreductase|nr:nitroreductase family protein [Lachnospiraceae bacterium]